MQSQTSVGVLDHPVQAVKFTKLESMGQYLLVTVAAPNIVSYTQRIGTREKLVNNTITVSAARRNATRIRLRRKQSLPLRSLVLSARLTLRKIMAVIT